MRGSEECKSVSDYENGAGIFVEFDSYEQRNIATVVYSLVKLSLDFRDKKWMVAASSSPPSKTINLTGEPRMIVAAIQANVLS